MSNRLTRDGTAGPVAQDDISGAHEDRKSVIFSPFLAYTIILYIFPCSAADHERDWLPPPCKVVFSGGQPIR